MARQWQRHGTSKVINRNGLKAKPQEKMKENDKIYRGRECSSSSKLELRNPHPMTWNVMEISSNQFHYVTRILSIICGHRALFDVGGDGIN